VAAPSRGRRPGVVDLVTVTPLCALTAGFGRSAEQWLAGYHIWLRQLAAAGCPPPTAHNGAFHVRSAATCGALKDRYPGSLQAAFASRYSFAILFSQDGLPAAVAIIGAMIGAPLVAREVEQRTELAGLDPVSVTAPLVHDKDRCSHRRPGHGRPGSRGSQRLAAAPARSR
jgi:hypothetical protein